MPAIPTIMVSGDLKCRAVDALCWLALSLAAGCAAQLGGGFQGDPGRGAVRGTLEVGARLHKVRGSGPYGSAGATLAPSGEAFGLHSLALGAGYRIRPATWLRVELGPEFGFGEPARLQYQRTGLFLGGLGAVVVRLPIGGGHDDLNGSAPVGWSVDLVPSGRLRRWSRAIEDGGGGQWELGAELALRVTLYSDLAVANDDAWEGPWHAR